MSQPPAYDRQYDFTGFSASQPSDQQPGAQIDAEFNAVKTTIDAIRSNIALIQRDDGRLANGSVNVEQLGADVAAFFSASSSWNLRGAWATVTVYATGDVVSKDGGTYLCGVAHVSGTFATDLSAGKWFTIYSTTATNVADGSITTSKLADSAVSATKLGISSLDLTSTIRGQGGIAAGTAVAGTHLVYGKIASGDARGTMERATRAQGAVGFRWNGGTSGVIYDLVQDASSDTLSFRVVGGADICNFLPGGGADFQKTLRVQGQDNPASGSGLEMIYSGGTSFIYSFNRTGSAWLPLSLGCLTLSINLAGVAGFTGQLVSGTPVFNATELTINSILAGYRGMPNNAQNGNYTLALTDAGKCIYGKNAGAQAITIPANATIAFSTDTTIAIINNGTTSLTIVPSGGVSLIWAGVGSTGTRTLAVKGMASIKKVESDTWFVSGAGLS